jgi:hypothetical protein
MFVGVRACVCMYACVCMCAYVCVCVIVCVCVFCVYMCVCVCVCVLVRVSARMCGRLSYVNCQPYELLHVSELKEL